MPDVRHSVAFIPRGYPDFVQRASTLYRLAPLARSEAQIAQRIPAVQTHWRARLYTLFEARAPFGVTERACDDEVYRRQRYFYARNCRPAFAGIEPPTTACTFWYCPFCYARSVGDLYTAVLAACPAPVRVLRQPATTAAAAADASRVLDLNQLLPADSRGDLGDDSATADPDAGDYEFDYHIFLQRQEFELGLLPREGHRVDARRLAAWPAGRVLDEVTWLQYCVGRHLALFPARQQQLVALGTVQQVTAELTAHGWHTEIRLLAKIRADAEIPASWASLSGLKLCQRITQPTKRRLAAAVASLFSYPRSWLRGDLQQFLLLLEMRRATAAKFLMRYGQFRSRRS